MFIRNKIRTALVYAMVALSIALGGVVITPAQSVAQFDALTNTTPAQRARIQTSLMKELLDLSPDQLTKISSLNESYAQKMEPVIQGNSGMFMKMRQMKEVNDAKESDLKALLSPDQFQKFLASKDEMRKKFEEQIEAEVAGHEH